MILTKKHFVNAAKYLEKHGLIKEDLGNCGGPACALGALKHANKLFSVFESVDETFGSTSNIEDDITSFNDHPKTTKEDVQTMLLFFGEYVSTLK